jgi:hypothetical protein
MITSDGKRKPAKLDLGADTRAGRRRISPPCPSPSSVDATDPTSHIYRRTAATIWNDAGILSDRQVGDLTCHKKIATLKDIYIGRGELYPEGAAVMDAAWLDT